MSGHQISVSTRPYWGHNGCYRESAQSRLPFIKPQLDQQITIKDYDDHLNLAIEATVN